LRQTSTLLKRLMLDANKQLLKLVSKSCERAKGKRQARTKAKLSARLDPPLPGLGKGQLIA
jgi:hypothetical protein